MSHRVTSTDFPLAAGPDSTTSRILSGRARLDVMNAARRCASAARLTTNPLLSSAGSPTTGSGATAVAALTCPVPRHARRPFRGYAVHWVLAPTLHSAI